MNDFTQIIGDSRVRMIESDAREASETGRLKPNYKERSGNSYWDDSLRGMDKITWDIAYGKRLARLERMKNTENKLTNVEISERPHKTASNIVCHGEI